MAPTTMPDTAPFTDWMGAELVSTENSRVVLRLQLRHDLHNRRHVAHGGVLATLLDSAMARAARLLEGVQALGGTTDLHVQFMAPGQGVLTATGWVEHAAKSLAFCRGEVRGANGALVASAAATMRLRRTAGE
jgi:uncharacterized protein (TIGR00369 family)